ncbi:PepSY domain-containing protein [Pseudomonas seleniipraecipitans]|uniref:PepSY domain-containing protein n=2 Tax=Phytopseudomonas seleniipraecipitans TaxID=640205 RepID=A0A1G7QSI7_9GAMM|nr:PepSY domain-containing protein [Pseudomonas seleniipraecipitans]UUD64241.1 PepSY domain-containing protein [Pseudomonas seleniipraecipitans]SDG01477.1 Peptidase propeptide and YPEB domain-containing protein [Pseudomonas seleniipraecipitans]
MKGNPLLRFISIMLLATLTSAASARDLDQDEARDLRLSGVILPLDQLMRAALERYPGATLLEAELEEEDDVFVYEVELLTREGVVRELELDAHDGNILKDEVDD